MSETLRDLVVSLSLNSDNFTRNIKSINKQIQEAESAFRLASAGVENFETTTAGLSSKLSTLQCTFQLQQDAVGQYERALQQASDKLQECHARQNDYAQRLVDAKDKQQQLKTEVASAAQAYKHYKNTLGETDSATIAAKANLDAYKSEYRTAVQEVRKLEGQNVALKKSTQNAADAFSSAQTKLNGAKAAVRETSSEIDQCNRHLALSQTSWKSAGKAMQASQRSIASIGKQMKTAESSYRLAAAGVKDFDKSAAGLTAKLALLQEKLNLQQKALAEYEKALIAAKEQLQAAQQVNDSDKIRQATDAVQDAETALNNARTAVKQTKADIANCNKELKTAQSEWTKAGKSMESFGKACDTAGKNLIKAGKLLSTTLTTPITALGTAAIKASIDFESSFTSVRKTVDATDVTVYENALVAAAEGLAAVNDQIDAQYDKEYALVQLIEDSTERQTALDELNARYNEERRAAAQEYAETLASIVMPVWNQPEIQQASQQMDELFTKLREYSMAGESEKPALLADLQALSASMDEGSLTEYLSLMTQIQSLLDSGMSEAEVQALFPDIDFSSQLDQFAGVVSYLDLIKTDLPGLYSMFGESLPEEVLKIATDLDMTGAQARWDEFAANPGAITTEAIITGLSTENQQVKVDAFIASYTEVPEGANTASLTPKGLIAYVEKYAEVTGGADVSGLTPEIAECLVAGYKELASGADVSLLKPDEIVAYVSQYAEQQDVDISGLSPEGLTAFVMAYEEATGGALTTALSPDDVTAMVAKYLQAENIDLSALTPDQIEAIVTRYAEATGCDKSQLLPSLTAYITEYREAEGVSVPKPKTQVIITGYDYLAYRQLQSNPDLTLELPVRLGELPDGELDRLMADGKVKFWKDGMEVPVEAVPDGTIDASTVASLDQDGTLHILITPEITGTKEAIDALSPVVDEVYQLGGTWQEAWAGVRPTTTMDMVDSGLKRIQSYQETLDYNWWDKFWASVFGASTNLGVLDQSMKSDFNADRVAELSAYVAEMVSAIQQGEQVPKEDLENLQALVDFLNGLDVTGTGAHIREGIAQGMTEAGFASDAETVASNLETALNMALQIESPSKRVKPTGEYASVSPSEIERIFQTAFDNGVNFFDTCMSVSQPAETIAHAIHGKRASLIMQNHLCVGYPQGQYQHLLKLSEVKDAFAGELRKYGTDYSDTLSGDLLNNLAAYIAAGNNTICLYNPSPVKSSQGYSTNYLQWSECTITVTYEEAASKPSLSKTSFDMGTAVTIYTNRQSNIATHTLRYSFFSSNGTIATGVTDSCTWTPPVSLAAQIPSATSGWGTFYCDTYVNGSLVSTNSCTFQLTAPASVVPSISSICADCVGLIKGYNWTNGGVGVIESIGTDKTFASKYGSHGCPDKSANGMFSYAKSKGCAWGTMDTLPEVPGVALRFDGHVGVYVGNGYAVEERGFNYGCVRTRVKDRKWTHWYQLPFVDYGDAVFTGGGGVKADTPASEYTLGTRTLQKGSKGTDVKALQEFLMQLGYALPKYGADGEFGTETETALKKLQAKAGVKQDGVYGSETHQALMDAIADNDTGKEPEQPDEPAQPDPSDTPATKCVRIVCGSGSVNIRMGNGTQYERITAVPNGTSFEWIATAQNGWHAIVVNGQVGWVSGKYSKTI